MSKKLMRMIRHPLSPFNIRAFYALLAFATVMIVGTLGLMLLEGWSPVNSFYFMALIATAEGPAATPATDAGKIFASVMAFVSIGVAISAITFTFGPLFGSVFRVGWKYVEREEERLKDRHHNEKNVGESS